MSYVYLSDLNPAPSAVPVVSDEVKAKALESQAADLKATAKVLESTQPGVAAGLKAQSDAMLKAADAFRKAAGLPDPSSLSTTTKVAIGVGILAGAGLFWKSRQKTSETMRFNSKDKDLKKRAAQMRVMEEINEGGLSQAEIMKKLKKAKLLPKHFLK